VTDAIQYAAAAHGSQVRKGTEIPYLSHLLSVAALTMEFGGSAQQCQAAALHDVVEDCGAEHLDVIAERFGADVAAMVSALSDATPLAGEAKPPWSERKTAYLDHLASLVAEQHPAVLVSACDKLHNAESIIADATDPGGDPGLEIFARFHASPAQTAWYYTELARALLPAAYLPERLRARLATATSSVDRLARTAASMAQ